MLTIAAAGCGHDEGGGHADLGGVQGRGDGAVDVVDGPDPDLGTGGDMPMNTSLLGIWDVSGADPRGRYTGQVELRQEMDGHISFIRVIRYAAEVVVEEDRELWWVWQGTATASASGLSLAIPLTRADFVSARGGITRAAADQTPLAVSGMVTTTAAGWSAHYTADGLDIEDVLTHQTPSGSQPIFQTDRAVVAAFAPPGATQKQTLFSTYASYQALPLVAPYANRPEFQAGVHYMITDKTDLAFYRAHPKALRVVDKVVDSISLGETLARANAFRASLADKAALLDADMPATFIDSTGMMVDSIYPGGVADPTGDGSLWTATYVASQAYRYLVTQDPAVLANIEKSVIGIQVLMEIVPDQSQFARTLRPATGSPTAPWQAGQGAFAGIEWMEGGNNDMYKGLFYGTLTGYMALCDPVIAGKEALCDRLRKNATHIVKDLAITQGTTDGNHLMALWLDAYINGSLSELLQAEAAWKVQAPVLKQANYQMRELATADWSGTHLTFVQFIGYHLLKQRKPFLGTDAGPTIVGGITTMRDSFQAMRMGLWSVLFATLASPVQAADAENARARLTEMPAPRAQIAINHMVAADFVMSPYPTAPWKNDWTTANRYQGIYSYPLFETLLDVYAWRSGPFEFFGDSSQRKTPGVDYLHAYWLGRYLGLFSATE